MKPVIEISIDGDDVRFLVSDDTRQLLEPGAIVRRASHVEPDAVALRLVFHVLRFMFGESGAVSDFTRQWPCIWRVNLAPTGGPVLQQRFSNRDNAIRAEVEYLNKNFI